MKTSRHRFPLFHIFTLLACALLAFPALQAAPSGGPYGPLQQRYEIPSGRRVIYVAPDAAASGSGQSLEQPTTLEKAIAQAVTDDVVVLRGGTYRVGSLKTNQGITLQPYADERPVLKGTRVATEWKAQANGLWRTSWKKLFPAKPADWWRREREAARTPLHLFNNDMVFVDGRLLAAVASEHEVTADTYFIDYPNGQVYLGVDPTNRLVEITAHDSAIIRTLADVHGKKNDGKGYVLRGLTFTQYAYRALEVEGTEPHRHMDPSEFGKEIVGAVLEHLTISFCSRVAGYFRGDGLVIRHCLVADCGSEGLYIVDSADVLLERNIVTRTNSAERFSGYYASAVKIFNQSYRVTCRDNLIIDNPHSSGIWYDVGNIDAVVVDNWIERTNDGFFYEISKRAICAGNIFVNCNRGIFILNSSEVQIYQNTFYNSVAWFERTERSSQGDHFGWHTSAGPDVHERHSHVFVNNLLAADETFQGPLLNLVQTPVLRGRLTESQLSTLDGNVYVRRAGAVAQPLIGWSPAQTETANQTFATLAALRDTFPKFETAGKEFPDYRGPLFRSEVLEHLELLAAFPGANVGAELPEKVRTLMRLEPGAKAFPGAYSPR